MSIKKLENIKHDYIANTQNEKEEYIDDIYRFMIETINIFKHRSDQIADLRQALAQKEDIITLSGIKEVKLHNG